MSGTGLFQISNGQIIDPSGNVFTARGINVYDNQMGDASQILADFPSINFIRLNVYSYQSPSAYASFIQTMTAHGVVVELEDHTNSNGSNAGGAQGSAFSGQQLTNEQNWYSSMASAYASNPYVWFGTDNEPPPNGLSAWEQDTYNAIRGAGDNSPILMELPGGGVPSYVGAGNGMDASAYASMTNIVWDAHYYGWVSGYSTDQQTVDNTLTSLAQSAQTIQSADGTVPVIVGEYGPATDGQNTDANGNQVLQAVQQSTATSGSVAWGWDTGENDNLTDGSGNLTSYGQEVANWMASSAAANPTPTPTPAPTPTPTAPPSPNDTVVTAGSTAALTDANGNQWTIVNGTVQENGQAAGYSANVTELAYVNGNVWQENNAGLWWEWNGSTWSGSGTATSPLPTTSPTPTPTPAPTPTPTPTATPSANDTVVAAESAAAITDANGNQWTIVNGAVQENGQAAGYSANVTEIAYVNGNVWQENSANMWWQWNGTSWPGNGTATSPLPTATPTPTPAPTPTPTPTATPSANDTVVTADLAAAITDANGNQWTIVNGAVQENGQAAGYSANVTEIAYVDGNVWQENSANMWWQWNGTSWPGNGTATSPLSAATPPATPTPAPTPTPTPAPTPLPVPSGPSANDTVVLAGSNASITDASGNAWTVDNGVVQENGQAAGYSANVTDLAYVNGNVWQENNAGKWWEWNGTSWPGTGTATSPLPDSTTIAPTATSTTVSQNQISVTASAGDQMVFVTGSGDSLNLTGGTETITDSGSNNTYVLPAAGSGMDVFETNILGNGGVLDLRTALAGTTWSGSAAALPQYLSVTNSASGAELSISATAGGAGTAIASFAGTTSQTLNSVLSHAIV